MKKITPFSIYGLLLVAVLSASSCKKTEETETLSYTEPVHQACSFDYGSAYETEDVGDVTTATVQQAFASLGKTYNPDKIVSAKLKSLTATISPGVNTTNFNDISTIQVLIKLPSASSGVQIAHAENIPSGLTTVSLTINAVELKSFITQQSQIVVKIANKGNELYADNCVNFSQGVIEAEVVK